MTKKIPKFKTVEEEIEFWETHDSTEYLDGSDHVEIDFSGLREKCKSKESRTARIRTEKFRKAAS